MRDRTSLVWFIVSLVMSIIALILSLISMARHVDAAEAIPSLSLSPAAQSVNVGMVFSVDILVDTGALTADTVDVYLTFDPQALEVVDRFGKPATSVAINGEVFAFATYNRVDNEAGRIDLSATKFLPPYLTGQFRVATVYLKAKDADVVVLGFVRHEPRWSDLYRVGYSIGTELCGATIVVSDEILAEPLPAPQLIQLTLACPRHYIWLDQELTIDYLITNVSGETLYTGYYVDNFRYQHVCEQPPDYLLPPMGQVHCSGPIWVTPADYAYGYVQVDAYAWVITESGVSYSNSATCFVDSPVKVYMPLALEVGR